jgi:cytochrome P450
MHNFVTGQQYGMLEMKVMISMILRKFEVTANKRLEELTLHYAIVVEPVGGFTINLKSRRGYTL